METYVWYGKDRFDESLFKEKVIIPNVYYNGSTKPKFKNLFWACDTNASNNTVDWKRFCEDELFRLDSFEYFKKFTLSNDTKILTINSYDDIYKFYKEYSKLPEDILYDLEILCNLCKRYNDIFSPDYKKNLSKAESERTSERILDLLSKLESHIWDLESLDLVNWNKIMDEYDAMELHHFDYMVVHSLFNLWDCDSICIWNKDKVILLEGGIHVKNPVWYK